MDVNGIPLLVVVGVVVSLAVIIARVWRTLLKWVLIVGGVAVVVAIAWMLIQRPDVIPDDTQDTISDVADIARVFTPKDEPAAPVYQTPAPSGGGFVAGLLVALLILALGAAGYFYARWQLVGWGGLRSIPRKHRQQDQPVIYVIEGQANDLGEYEPVPWDWEESEQWTEDDLFPF
jgi:hypothetical protein